MENVPLSIMIKEYNSDWVKCMNYYNLFYISWIGIKKKLITWNMYMKVWTNLGEKIKIKNSYFI